MAELVPIPLNLQLHRAFLEFEREGRIFHLPKQKFFSGQSGLDTSVVSNGHRASTPLGPAAGPHTQMMQNIVLCWLAGSRIIELKTVQVLEDLKLPRPCIDSAAVTYNVEWSQELKLEQSLREYVSATMFLEIVKASGLLREHYPVGCDDTIFDMSIGYNLEGICSPKVRAWIEGMKDATRVIEDLRSTLTGRFRQFRGLPFNPRISDTITLSTFHGCPPEEIEGIVRYLLTEMGLHVCVKMNPTLLGRDEVSHLLHDVLRYRDIQLSDDAFNRDLKFAEALDLLPRLDDIARANGRQFSVKFSNTLVVRNHRQVFRDELMYMSGPALHVLTLNLVKRFREQMGSRFPMSFSAGLNAQNMPDMVAMDFVPVTTCTDLLKPGGYGRLPKYMENLGTAMRSCGAATIAEFVLLHAGQGTEAIESTAESLRELLRNAGLSDSSQPAKRWVTNSMVPALLSWHHKPATRLNAACAQLARSLRVHPAISSDPRLNQFIVSVDDLENLLVSHAGLLNSPVLVERATVDPRYRWKKTDASLRKSADLSLYDCIACDKCVAVCPNAANFAYETPNVHVTYADYEIHPDGTAAPLVGEVFTLEKSHQFANYADACNDCGNCDAACPENGSPNVAKPRFFGTMETFVRDAGRNGFLVTCDGTAKIMHAVIAGARFTLRLDTEGDVAQFENEHGEFVLQPSRNQLISWLPKFKDETSPQHLDMQPYVQMKVLLEAVLDSRRTNYINVKVMGALH